MKQLSVTILFTSVLVLMGCITGCLESDRSASDPAIIYEGQAGMEGVDDAIITKSVSEIKLTKEVLEKDEIVFNLPEMDAPARLSKKTTKKDSVVWEGAFEDDPDGSALLVQVGDAVTGEINYLGRLYTITYTERGEQVLYELEQFVDDHADEDFHSDLEISGDDEILSDVEEDETAFSSDQMTRLKKGETVEKDPAHIINILVAYTPYSIEKQGGEDQIRANTLKEIHFVNQTLKNSGVKAGGKYVRLNLCYMGKVEGYTEERVHLGSVKKGSGKLGVIKEWREKYKADIITVVAKPSHGLGLAWILKVGKRLRVPQAFAINVCCPATWGSGKTFPHELGHTFGGIHAGCKSEICRHTTHGWKDCDGIDAPFATHMTSCKGAFGKDHYYSNTVKKYHGKTMGNEHANLAGHIAKYSYLYANLRKGNTDTVVYEDETDNHDNDETDNHDNDETDNHDNDETDGHDNDETDSHDNDDSSELIFFKGKGTVLSCGSTKNPGNSNVRFLRPLTLKNPLNKPLFVTARARYNSIFDYGKLKPGETKHTYSFTDYIITMRDSNDQCRAKFEVR